MDFGPIINAQLNKTPLMVNFLAEFQFLSSTIRVHEGFGVLKTLDDRVWSGLAQMGTIRGLSQSINGSAPLQTFILSGVDASFSQKARAERTEYLNRPVIVSLQFFDRNTKKKLANPWPLTWRQMSKIKSKRKWTGDHFQYTIELSAETPFVTRGRPPFAYLNPVDQEKRFPGMNDRGLDDIVDIDSRPVTFPDYDD